MSKKENPVALEVAERAFEDWVVAMDLDLDTSDMDAEDLTGFNNQRKKIIIAIQRGALTFNDDGEAVYVAQNEKSKHKEPITFHERTGASIMAMDGKKKNHDAAKMYSVLADMCKVHPKVFAGLVGTDVKVCEALFSLLMA